MTKALPEQISQLVQVLKAELAAEVEVERIENLDPFPDRFRIAIVAPRFESMGQLDRQDLIWAIVDRVLSRGEVLAISMILAFSPNELEPLVFEKHDDVAKTDKP